MSSMPALPSRPWWRHPFMWLVVGGPLAVVVASTATAVLALRGADVVVESEGRIGAERPAVQARNHAAAPAARRTPR